MATAAQPSNIVELAAKRAGARSSSSDSGCSGGDIPDVKRCSLKLMKPPTPDYWKSMLVSIDCGEDGYFQGIVDSFDRNAQTISLSKAFVDGRPKEDGKIVLCTKKMKSLKILRLPEDEAPEKMSIVEDRRRTRYRHHQHETQHHNSFLPPQYGEPSSYQANNGSYYQNRNGPQNGQNQWNKNGHSGEYRGSPTKQGFRGSPRNNFNGHFHADDGANRKDDWKKRMIAKDDACFGTPVDCFMDEEFDFEKNLAMFDKKEVFKEITANQKNGPVKRQMYFRHDESVLRVTTAENYRGTNDHQLQGGQKSAFTKPEPSRRGGSQNVS